MLSRPTAFLWLLVTLAAVAGSGWVAADEPRWQRDADELTRLASSGSRAWQYRTPAMIGDFYFGTRLGLSAENTLDRLFVLANDLDVPGNLPPTSLPLSLSEAGPVGVFSGVGFGNIQQLQALLRSNQPTSAVLVGTINSNAELMTAQSLGDLQNQLSGTTDPFDIIQLAPPPGSYTTQLQALFSARNGPAGVTRYDAAGSGALLQDGSDALVGGEDLDAFYYFDYRVLVDTRLADATSGGVGRMKIAEGGTVLPQDRIYCRYSFADAVRYADGVGHSRFVPGFERSFLDQLLSLEVRLPIAARTTGTETTFDPSRSAAGGESRFGNMTVYGKVLLSSNERLSTSGGLGVGLPTAQDLSVSYADGTPLLLVANESVRLQPFFASLYTPSNKWYVQTFVQYDVAANGNSVAINADGSGLAHAGRLTDSSNLFFDVGLGYWLLRSHASSGLTGVIPTVELHQNWGLQASDSIEAGAFRVGDLSGVHSLTNIVAGTTFEFNQRSHLSLAYVAAVGGGVDRQFDGGLQVFYSHPLGR